MHSEQKSRAPVDFCIFNLMFLFDAMSLKMWAKINYENVPIDDKSNLNISGTHTHWDAIQFLEKLNLSRISCPSK